MGLESPPGWTARQRWLVKVHSFHAQGLACGTCDIPIPTVKAAADVAACPTKGKAGSMMTANCLPNRLQRMLPMGQGERAQYLKYFDVCRQQASH